MKNKTSGILGSAIACGITEVVLNIIVNGFSTHLIGAFIAGLVLGGIVGCAIAVFGSNKPLLVGVGATAVVFAAIIAAFAAASNTVIHTPIDLVVVAGAIVVIGLVNGFGYRLLGPKS